MLKGITFSLLIGAVRVEPVPAEVADALLEAQVSVTAGQRSGFQLKFALAKDGVLDRRLLPGRSLDPPNRVILVVHVDGVPTVLMDGVITRHDVVPSNDAGQSTLTLTGVDVTQMMDLVDMSWLPLPAMPPELCVGFIVAKYAMYGIVPRIVPSLLLLVPNPLQQIPNQQGTDYEYVTKLADDAGYVFYVEPGPRPGQNLAYWGPEIRAGQVQPALSVNMDAATNVESLSFSFDGISKSVPVVLGHLPHAHLTIPVPVPDITPLNPPLGRKIPLPLTIKPINAGRKASASEQTHERDDATAKYDIVQTTARALARAAQSANVVSASGSLDVLRYGRLLEARRLVGVRGAGPAYDGEYYVKSVTSTLKPGEFKQRFSLSRNAQVAISGAVSP
ncbi:hypothetical protein J1792_17410 [Streptomyces triculaminicus]|uniref:Phage protein D n=1 Tax=Streptomyces triculaminicus TaxID=2816232 RepID=A0A939JRM7_9ACTN|nr:hypothetical protein [Streptomyces triculaminicus]MBO0654495.1 hypothetical protein [Streptomyces triculaminicus]